MITGNHLDFHAESLGVVNGLLGIFTGRIEDGKETDQLETIALSLMIITPNFLEGDSQGTETTHGEFLNVSLEPVLDFIGLVARAKLDDDASHTLGDAHELSGGLFTVGTFGAFVDGIKWLEVEDLDTGMGLGGIRDGTNDTSIDGVLIFGTGGIGSQLDDIISRERSVGPDGGTIDGELVGGESASLVRAKDGDCS